MLGQTGAPYRVIDTIGAVLGASQDPAKGRPGNKESVPLLAEMYSRDGVHLGKGGLHNLSKSIFATIKGLVEGVYKSTAGSSFSGPGSRFYWQGFNSPVGSK